MKYMSKMERLICLFGKWYDSGKLKLKYKTYCTNNTLEDDKLWKENIEKWSGDENKQYKIYLC